MNVKTPIPKAQGIDNTLALIKEGFHFLPGLRKELESDIFETRLMGQKVICMGGKEAAEMFYNNNLFKRKDAVPTPIKKSLLGEGGVHGLDDEAHKQRKRMFLSMMTPERLEDVRKIAVNELDSKVAEWETKENVVFFEEIKEVLTRTGCKWAGIPLRDQDVKQRAWELGEMVDSFGGSVARFRSGKKARESQEKWLKGIVKNVRSGKIPAPANTAAYIISHHREPNGKQLDAQIAAVELNNIIRPIVATAYYLTFGAMALHEHPETISSLKENKSNYSLMFAQEVRRFYPFAPAMGAKVKKSFYWHNYHFKKNMLVILDIFGTNHHPDIWDHPDEFKPERFKDWKGSPFSFIPQGGGDHIGHRCAGEWVTVMIMRSFFQYLTENITYTVPDQNLNYSMTRMPTVPKSRFVITRVKKLKKSLDDLEDNEQTHTVI
ncbi:cytochrome P450 [Salipaludibacillus sp. CF4.18]|uniref:cytochrome P450 n=1 Tax=Salipaludibacillus sp. CF4.18 TaxID=3373081 RepID=UPI003EE4E5B5